MRTLLAIFAFTLFFTSCKTSTITFQNGREAKVKNLNQYLEKSEEVNSYFFGMQLYDLEDHKVVFDHQSNLYFTPASNTKLLTLYSTLHVLKDSVAFMQEFAQGGTMIYQPMADPSFLHPALHTDERITEYFKSKPQDTIHFNLGQFKDEKFGSGWAWNDYGDYYQTEKSAFPIASNLLYIRNDSVSPAFVPDVVHFDEPSDFSRAWETNEFYAPTSDKAKYIPFHVDESLFRKYFKSQGKEVVFEYEQLPKTPQKTIYSEDLDSVLYVLMQDSDNHIAEQLILQASQLQLGYMNTSDFIDYSKKEILNFTPDQLNWVDGSGLSRYNLFTPRSLVTIMNKIVEEQGIEWIQNIFSVGGKSGTIAKNYSYSPPRVFAKTGTLRNNHCLTGIVQTNSGKWYSFSMMNNHYPNSTSTAKAEMENILKIVIEQY